MLRILRNKTRRHSTSLIFMGLIIISAVTLIRNISLMTNADQMDQINTVLRNITKSKPKNISLAELNLKYKMGHINVHLWYKVCSSSTDSLRQLPLFPLWPSVRGQPEMPNDLISIMSNRWSAQRLMGFLYPPISGVYRFKITSGWLSEFWLSKDENPAKAVFLAKNSKNRLFGVEFEKDVNTLKSQNVHLQKGSIYYFDVIHMMNDIPRDQVRIQWMLPGATSYTGIPKTAIFTAIKNDTSLDSNTRNFVTSSPILKPQKITLKRHTAPNWLNKDFSKPFSTFPAYSRDNVHVLEYADSAKIMSSFNKCDYSPTYTKRRVFQRNQGVYWTRFDDVFPDDHTHGKIWKGFHEKPDRRGNTLIEEDVVVDIVNIFMETLNDGFPGEYNLANVVNVERNVDAPRGNRFFLELVLKQVNTGELKRLSEYVYQFMNDPSVLCKPKGLEWSAKTKIHAILTTKAQGPWVVHYFKNMAQAVHFNNDENVHFIIVDYGNNGLDIKAELNR